MSKLSISMPGNLLDTINQRIESGDYSSISDYIRDLIRRDMQQLQRAGDDSRKGRQLERRDATPATARSVS